MSSIVVKITAGDTVAAGDIQVTLLEGGVAVSLDGASATWETRYKMSGVTRSSAMTVLGSGVVSPIYTASESAALEPGEHLAQVRVLTASGSSYRWPGPDQGPISMIVAGAV